MSSNLGRTETLPFLSSEERLKAYQLIVNGCSHLWSKNELQKDKLSQVLQILIPLTKTDPYFLAHLTSYAFKKSQSRDLQVVLAYISSLSSADGTPFSLGSEYVKPNLRSVGLSALHMLDPKMVDRVVQIANTKYGVPGYLNEAQHFPTTLRTSVRKYLEYMNQHPERVVGIKKAGLGKTLKRIYVAMKWKPSEEIVKILRWKRKDIEVDFGDRPYNFEKLSDLQIARLIRKEQIPYIGIMGELARIGKRVSPVIAVAMLEQATGNQAVIMRATFEDAGILKDPDVFKMYKEKIKLAKTAIDRADTISSNASMEVKEALSQARAANRQAQTVGIGKVYLHLDDSGSMQDVRDIAIHRGATIAECVNDARENFRWGLFGARGIELPLPREFVRDAFAQVLFGQRDGGSTNCFALYPNAREFGADVDIFVTDQDHTDGNLSAKIKKYHENHPDVAKPKACVIIHVTGRYRSPHTVKEAYEANGIPAIEMQPETLVESALVVEAVKNAILGPIAIIDEIMESELLRLPRYYFTV